jgi:hypothetical protein
MTLVERFAVAVGALESRFPGPELLPRRLATACVEVLSVDGASVSFTFLDRRLPLGASDAVSAEAERIEYTLGEGPCLTARSSGLPLVADETALRDAWPAYHDALVSGTPIRGVIAVPLLHELQGVGVLDLYVVPPRDVRDVRLADAVEVSLEVVRAFGEVNRRASRSAGGPAWLDAPSVGSRAVVWQAMGFLSSALEISGSDALALLRAHAFGRGATVDEIAALVLSRELPATDFAVDAPDG